MLFALAAVLVSIVVIVAIFATVWISQSKGQAPAKALAQVTTNTIGIPYHSSNADVNLLMGDMQTILSQAVVASCQNPERKQAYQSAKDLYITAVKSKGNVSCDAAKTMLASVLANLPMDQFDSAGAQTLKTNLTTLYTHAINAVCVNDVVDAAKLGQLLDDMYAATC